MFKLKSFDPIIPPNASNFRHLLSCGTIGYGTAAAELTENLLYLCTVLINVYVASPDPDPNPRGGGQLLNANECNEGETLTPNPNECNSTLTSGTSGGTAPTYTIYTGVGGQLPNPKSAILLYANECSEERDTLIPNPNECNSTLTSGTNNISPYLYIDVNDRDHRFRLGSPLSNYPHATSYRIDRRLHLNLPLQLCETS